MALYPKLTIVITKESKRIVVSTDGFQIAAGSVNKNCPGQVGLQCAPTQLSIKVIEEPFDCIHFAMKSLMLLL